MHFVIQLPPNKQADMTVMNQTRDWVEGGVLLFDDSIEHHVRRGHMLFFRLPLTPDH